MVKRLCPTSFLYSNMVFDPREEPTHEVLNCAPVVTEQDIQKQKVKRISSDTSDPFSFIYGYCEDENILFVHAVSFLPFFHWRKYLQKRRFRTLIDFKNSDSAEIMPESRDNIYALRLPPCNLIGDFNPVNLTCSRCHEQDLRQLECNNEIIKTVLVCYNIFCRLVYIFNEKNSFIPINCALKPVKIPFTHERRKSIC